MQRSHQWGFFFASPWIVGLITLTLYPFCASLYWSFCRYDLLGTPRWVGLDNYRRLANELVAGGEFGRALWNTCYYACVSVPASIALGVLLALLLARQGRGQAVFRTLFFLPSMVPLVAASILWMWLLDPGRGLVNALLFEVNIPAQGWFRGTSELLRPDSWPADAAGNWAGSKDALALMSLWGVGNFMVIYLAALGDVPRSLYEAARIDGAGAIRRLWHITLPMLSPIIFFNLVMGVIQSVQAFTQVYLVSDGRGDPAGASLMLSLHIFLAAFKDLEMGYASAMAWVVFVIVLIMTWWLFFVGRYWVVYRAIT